MADERWDDSIGEATMAEKWQADDLEWRIYEEQSALIAKHHGKDAADNANYGWGVSGDERYVSVATKVYGHGVLVSEAHHPSHDISHEWQD